MENFNKPEGQTTSDNFVVSETDIDSFEPQSLWGKLSLQDENYLSKKGLKTPVELLKSYRELEKAFSSKISIPKDGDKEALDKLYSRLGMPNDVNGFEIEFLPEDLELGGKFKEVCLQNNILTEAASKLYDWFVKSRNETIEKLENEREENSRRERDEKMDMWGAKATRNTEFLRRGLRLVGDDFEVVDAIEQVLGTAKMMDIFCRLGEALSEDNPVSFGSRIKSKDDETLLDYFREVFNE
jgi:hypothetical protein